MSQELRARRDALVRELREVERELSVATAEGPILDPSVNAGALLPLIEQAPCLILVIDPTHRVTYINRLPDGVRPDEILDVHLEDIVLPEGRKAAAAAIDDVIRSGRTVHIESQVMIEGERATFDTWLGALSLDGRTEGVLLFALDVSARKRAEEERSREHEALGESERRFRTLFENAPDAIVIFDMETIRFVDVNQNAVELFGRPREELLRVGPVELSPERQPDGSLSSEAGVEWVLRAAQGEMPVFEWDHVDAEGQVFPCEVRLVMLEQGSRTLVRASVTDIRARRRRERESAELATQLNQSQKMEALGQLTGGVAHDFNNLLTVIIGSLELADMDPAIPEETRQQLGQAMSASVRAGELTQRLLAFSRKQALQPTVVELNELVAGMATLLRRTLSEKVAIDIRPEPELWRCEADPGQLENVVLNLAINARDAMTSGGRLSIETANRRLGAMDVVGAADLVPGDYVLLQVSDTGVGMEEQVLRHAFEPFFTTKDMGRGSGLGLSMAYGFAKQSGGHLELTSVSGQGTQARLYLPRSHAGANPLPDRRDRAGRDAGRGERVLLLEDDEAVRTLALDMLIRLGYRPEEAASADAALRLLRESGPFDLLLTDVILPGAVNGAAVAKEAAQLQPQIRVLLMSGYTEDAILKQGRLEPGVVLLEKPFTRKELARKLRSILDGEPGA